MAHLNTPKAGLNVDFPSGTPSANLQENRPLPRLFQIRFKTSGCGVIWIHL